MDASHDVSRRQDSAVYRVDGEPVMRAYTPTSSDDDLGIFDLVIKVHPLQTLSPQLSAQFHGQNDSCNYLIHGTFYS